MAAWATLRGNQIHVRVQCRAVVPKAGTWPTPRALPALVVTPLGCFMYGGVNASRSAYSDLWHLAPADTASDPTKPGVPGWQWHACKCLPMCPLEHAVGPAESAPSRSFITSDRTAVCHDGAAFAVTHDTQLVVRPLAICESLRLQLNSVQARHCAVIRPRAVQVCHRNSHIAQARGEFLHGRR